MSDRYHYTGCGLDYVYLANGYTIRETVHGKGFSVQDARGLHNAIAVRIVSRHQPITGQEVRFLRAQMGLSQSGLGKILGVSRAAVARWEGKPKDAIPATADRALRMFYALKIAGNKVAKRIVDLLGQIDDLEYQMAVFEETDRGWEERKAA